MHLNMWGQGSPFLVSSLGGLVLLLALQHHTKCWWWSVKCGLLHWIHLASWIQHIPTVWLHFQQFLHWGTPRFIFAPHTVAMKLLMLKHLLMIFLAFDPLWVFQISIQMMNMLDLGETLMMQGLNARTMSLKRWLLLRMFLTSSEEIWEL